MKHLRKNHPGLLENIHGDYHQVIYGWVGNWQQTIPKDE